MGETCSRTHQFEIQNTKLEK